MKPVTSLRRKLNLRVEVKKITFPIVHAEGEGSVRQCDVEKCMKTCGAFMGLW